MWNPPSLHSCKYFKLLYAFGYPNQATNFKTIIVKFYNLIFTFTSFKALLLDSIQSGWHISAKHLQYLIYNDMVICLNM